MKGKSVRTFLKERIRNYYFQVSTYLPSLLCSPNRLRIEITTFCNLRCVMCEHHYFINKDKNPLYKSKNLSFEDFKRIINKFPNLKRIELVGLGENLLNKEFLKMCKYLKQRNIRTLFFDNFTLMNPKISEELIKIGVDELFISLDGATKEVFEKIRKGANFKIVLNNIQRFISIKKKLYSNNPDLKICFVIQKKNVHQMPLIVDLASRLGVKSVFFEKMIPFNKFTAGLVVDDLKLSNFVEETKIKANKNHINVKFIYFSKKPITKCQYPWTSSHVMVDGFFLPCCFVSSYGEREKVNSQSFGNILTQNFGEIWTSKKYSYFRKNILKGKKPASCTTCALFE